MKKIILVAESGSDITPEIAEKYGVYVVPMHVNFGEETVDDGTFDPQKIVDYYRETGNLPKTSGSTPGDFEVMFDKIHEEHPDAHILYLAYSAVTTCSYQSAVIAAEDRDYVTAIDTKQVSAGQCAIVAAMGEILNANPDMTIEEAVKEADKLIEASRMCFVPDNLEFLRAGGRVSNAAFLGAQILSLHPCIEILEGKLMATKKYRGKMVKVAKELVKEYSEKNNLKKDLLWIVYTVGISDAVKEAAETAAKECGFENIEWLCCNGVITTHGGPAAFGIAGFSAE